MDDNSANRDRTRVRMKARRLLPLERVGASGGPLRRIGRALLLWVVSATLFWTVFTVDFGLGGGARLTLVVVLFMSGIYTGVAGAAALVTGASLTAPRV